MRFLAILMSMAAWVSAGSAQTAQESAVTLFKEVCVAPATPEAMMAAGESLASARGWTLDQTKSGRHPLRLGETLPPAFPEPLPDSNEPRILVVKIWDGSLSTPAAQIKMGISIVGPENPELRYNLCAFVIQDRMVDEMAPEISRLLPSLVRSKNSKHFWYLRQEGQNTNDCGKAVMLNSFDNFTMLSFVDAKLPAGNQGQRNWPCK